MRSVAWLCVAACSYAPEPGAAPIDTPVDVVIFDPVRDCPVEYTIALAGQASRYRVITNGAKAWEHSDDCNNDMPGKTHLIAIDDQAELDQVEIVLDAIGDLSNNTACVGGVQLRDQIAPGVGWLLITGGPLLTTAWADGEPNDGSNEDNDENFAGIERGRQGLVDFPSNDDQGAMCECDGKPADITADAAVNANRE